MSSKISPHVTTAARVLLGLVFFVFGLNGFLQFMPVPPPGPQGGAFLGALAATGYMFPLLKGVEVVAGALLLANRAVPLALVALAPIIVNIAAYHLILEPSVGMVVALVALEVYLAYAYRSNLLPLLGGSAAARHANSPGTATRAATSIAS